MNPLAQLITVSGVIAIFSSPLYAAPSDARSLGCILREGDSARFIEGRSVNKEVIIEALISAARSSKPNVLDPCLTGQQRNITKEAYAALAEAHPEKFQPLPGESGIDEVAERATMVRQPTYRYMAVDNVVQPQFLFIALAALTNRGSLYGTAFELSGETIKTYVAAVDGGKVRLLQEGYATAANEGGTVGGWVITDPENSRGQAALFRGSEVEMIPRAPGEIHSEVLVLNDRGTAVVVSQGENDRRSAFLYSNGQLAPLDFGPQIRSVGLISINNEDVISGTTFVDGLGGRGFRLDTRTGVTTLLEPQGTETHSWALDINNRGDILGYSFIAGATERIGVWDPLGRFHVYFVEGTPEFPTISNRLHFNDNNQIVITHVSNPPDERSNSYLVTKPGQRLNLAEQVTDRPAEEELWWVQGINNYGDVFGLTSAYSSFLLKRTSASTK